MCEPGCALDAERDPLVAEFVALRAEVSVEPPGVPAARRMVARRRRTRLSAAAGFAVMVVVAGLGWVQFAGGGRPTGVAKVAVSGAASEVGPDLFMAPVSQPPSSPAPRAGSQCRGYGVVAGGPAGGRSVTVRAAQATGQPLCDGARVRVFWAVYRLDAAGVQHLYQSQVHYLDPAHNPLRLTYQVPACPWSIYVVAGDQEIRGSIPAMANFASQAPTAYSTGGVLYVHQQTCPTAVSPRPSATLMER